MTAKSEPRYFDDCGNEHKAPTSDASDDPRFREPGTAAEIKDIPTIGGGCCAKCGRELPPLCPSCISEAVQNVMALVDKEAERLRK